MPKRVELFGEDVFVVENFLSESRCQKLIGIAEEIGFTPATVHTERGHEMREDWRTIHALRWTTRNLRKNFGELQHLSFPRKLKARLLLRAFAFLSI